MMKRVRILLLSFMSFSPLAGCFGGFDTGPIPLPDAEENDGDAAQDPVEAEDRVSDPDGNESEQPDGASCGNGIRETGEECDDGNGTAGDGCEPDCRWTCIVNADCSDGAVCNGDEVCEAATHTCGPGEPREMGFVCLTEPRSICLGGSCLASTCGDGFVDTGGGESCEPPGVGSCSESCRQRCASDADCEDDGNPCNGGEHCDPGLGECVSVEPLDDGTRCGTGHGMICIAGNCQASICGDGFVDPGNDEDCDDGNHEWGDGCDPDCTLSCYDDEDCHEGRDCGYGVCDPDAHTCSSAPLPAGFPCRYPEGPCDVQEVCDGTGYTCPADGVAPPGTVCRPAAGSCDVAEACDGRSVSCPGDAFVTSSTPCRSAPATCNPTESCTGSSPLCPPDLTNCQIYQRAITVDNTANPSTLTDYQVLVVMDTAVSIAAGRMRLDCGDLRFTDTDRSTALGYWIEAGCTTAFTIVWVRVPQIPGGATKTIYATYGDPSLTGQSSIPQTFLAGSDFAVDEGLVFVEDGVPESLGDMSGELQSAGGYLSFRNLDRTADTYVYKELSEPLMDGYAIRVKMRHLGSSGPDGRFVQPVALAAIPNGALGQGGQNALEIAGSTGAGWIFVEEMDWNNNETEPIPASLDTWYIIELVKLGSEAAMIVYHEDYSELGEAYMALSWPDAERTYFLPYGRREASWGAFTFSGDQDWSLVRRFTYPEPVTSVGSETPI
jgi:cysteine-rich repeat protein